MNVPLAHIFVAVQQTASIHPARTGAVVQRVLQEMRSHVMMSTSAQAKLTTVMSMPRAETPLVPMIANAIRVSMETGSTAQTSTNVLRRITAVTRMGIV